MPSWPADLPYEADMSAFKILEITRPSKFTEFEDGPPLGRPSGAGRRAKLQYKVPWDDAAKADRFMTFFETELADGTARFQMPVWIPALNGYHERTVMFDQGRASVDPFGLGFAASFTLIVFKWRTS